MALENINCPQFVDFTSDEPFNMQDGADFCFDKRVVGELDLGFGTSNSIKNDKNDDLPNNETKILTNSLNYENNNKIKEVPSHNNKNNNKKQVMTESDKENKIIDNIVGETKTTVCSAIEMMSCSSVLKQSNNYSQNIFENQTGTQSNKSKIPIEQKSSTNANNSQHRPRNPSTVSRSSNSSLNKIKTKSEAENEACTIIQTQPCQNNMNSQNIVKKTFAKMTAAFKQSTKTATSAASDSNSMESLKKKLISKKSKNLEKNIPNGPIKVDYNPKNELPMSIMASNTSPSNRRCSSVPRTLKEKQAVNRLAKGLDNIHDEHLESEQNLKTNHVMPPTLTSSLGEKIQCFFNSHNTNDAKKFRIKNGIIPDSSIKKTNFSNTKLTKNNQASKLVANKDIASMHRRRSKSSEGLKSIAGDSVDVKQNRNPINNSNIRLLNNKVMNSPSQHNKARQRSADRVPTIPLYQGVKFIPKLSHKYQQHSAEGSSLVSNNFIDKTDNLSSINTQSASNNETNSNKFSTLVRSASGQGSFRQNKNIVTASQLASSSSNNKILVTNHQAFKVSPTKENVNKSNTTIDNAIELLNGKCSNNDSKILSGKLNLNESNSSSKINTSSNFGRKKSETKPIGFLHTELRAQRRHEYETSLKEKERIANIIRKDLEIEKMKKQHEEIQKIRMQRTFRSRPIKHYKPVDIKPSEKPLTEPKSPEISLNIFKLSNKSISPTCLSNNATKILANALVDAPLSSNKNEIKITKKFSTSHDDIRLNYQN